MSETLQIALAQCNFLVGDIVGNCDRIIAEAATARTRGADMVLFSELALTGYPPEDLLLRPSLQPRIEEALHRIAASSSGIAIVVGFPWREDGRLYNCAGIWSEGACLGRYAKQCLPNYQVFDEQRYFSAGYQPLVVDYRGHRLGLTICEDIWHQGPIDQCVGAGAELVLNLNASPYHIGKHDERVSLLKEHTSRLGVPILYVNQVGGQDELVFDGASFAMAGNGDVVLQMAEWNECQADVCWNGSLLTAVSANAALPESELASLYQALVTGVRDYVNKNRFKGVVLGLSGGIDSALTLAIAVDALGADRVEAVMMPFAYTSDMSKEDAALQATKMGVQYRSISIAPMYDAFMESLAEKFAGMARDTTEENLQSRCRGVLLMAISNKTGYMVLTTGNKSEMAVGYATLYGDMAGGYGAIKDVYKTRVFDLANYRNSIEPVIPQRVIDRPPSAELAPGQVDQDSLPPYPVLDAILESYIEQDMSAEAIIASGFSREDVMRVVRLVDINEYKRRQAPVGVRVTRRGFGRDRRYPLTNGWKAGV
ncbi:NAD+ synthase [Parathalassolituus penaei]|uniref:Glutamine-dependent NAD(+) synthetase n=1 Tax=Parathalassolituus penaei TaxID=2997323 RepID=A0A9X3EB83_9GAMM|nr:NAD+ synthase [Parathalassolituus penaei]MCY0964412.1 NAD+ synthase [Parathalassolituus penaei]